MPLMHIIKVHRLLITLYEIWLLDKGLRGRQRIILKSLVLMGLMLLVLVWMLLMLLWLIASALIYLFSALAIMKSRCNIDSIAVVSS